MMPVHLQETCRIGRHVHRCRSDLDAVMHDRLCLCAALLQRIAADLAVRDAAMDMVGGPAQDDAFFLIDADHLIILACDRDELSRQIHLADLTQQIGAQEVHILLILCHIAGIMQIAQIRVDEALIIDIQLRMEFLIHGDLIVEADLLHLDQMAQVLIDAIRDEIQTDLLAQEGRDIFHLAEQQFQLCAHFFDAHRRDDHAHDQLEHHIARCAGKVRGKGRNGLRVTDEDLRIVVHVLPKQILRRDHMDERLITAAGEELSGHLEEVMILILYDHACLTALRRAPEVRDELQHLADAMLLEWNAGVITDQRIILSGDPLHVYDREAVIGVPADFAHAVFQRDHRHFAADAQITRHAWEQLMVHIAGIGIPHHKL